MDPEGELFVNILSAVNIPSIGDSKQHITLQFDGYRNAVPDSNAIHPQQSAAGINQVYVRSSFRACVRSTVARYVQSLVYELTFVARAWSQWYIKPSPVSPNAYSIKQRYTGRILTYPKRLTADSRLTVEEASDSLWEIRQVGEGYSWV